MGAISASSSIAVLREFVSDANRDVRETCEIALAKIEWDHSEEGKAHRQREHEQAERGAQCVHLLGYIFLKYLSPSSDTIRVPGRTRPSTLLRRRLASSR